MPEKSHQGISTGRLPNDSRFWYPYTVRKGLFYSIPLSLMISALAVIFAFGMTGSAMAGVTEEIEAKNRQIEELQRQIDQYQQQIDETRSKSSTLQNEISKLNASISQIQLEIKSLGFAIDQTNLEIQDTEAKIVDAEGKLEKHKNALAQYVRLTYEIDQRTLTEVLMNTRTLSDFFNDLHNVQTTQENISLTIERIKGLKEDLGQHKDVLEDKRTDLNHMKRLQEVEKKSLDGTKSQKDRVLKETKGQESKFQEMVKKSKTDIERIREQVFYLQQNGVSVEDAIKYGQLAAIRAGIRPAFLLAILEIESGLGRNVGTGNWMDDMVNCYLRLGKPARAETEKNAFLAIVGKLGLDPDTVKVSREPNYGCGGALGPAQFIPSTWLAYEERVADLTGHSPPNPWSIEDAFMASAIKLANGGATAKTTASESRAARAYLSGKASCTSSICNYYASAVLRKAASIEQSL